jgi:hypothetical protein
MTFLFFCFRHTCPLTVHTDLHGHTASRCLCRSRPLQWCSMYLSRLSGCPKSSRRGAPSSGISLLGTKSNHQALHLTNTEGGRSSSHFSLGQKLLSLVSEWRLTQRVNLLSKQTVLATCFGYLVAIISPT